MRIYEKERANLDDAVLAGDWIEGVLNVTLADDTEMTDDVDGRGPEHVVVLVRESLRRSDDDRVSGMDT
jgi:hypothetical protein